MMTRYPQLSEQLKRASDTMNDAQQKSFLQQHAQTFAALQGGRSDVAEKILRDSAAAKRNSGMEAEAKQDETLAEMVRLNPDIARSSVAFRLSGIPGGDKIIDSAAKLGAEQRAADKAPSELRTAEAGATKAEADAKTAGVAAKYADSAAVADLEKKGWDVKKIVSDIDINKQQARIAAMTASIAREGNDLKREELRLKVQEARQKLDDKVRDKAADFESQRTALDDSFSLVREITESSALSGAVGLIGGATGTIPGTEARTVAGKIEQLQNSLAAANLDKLKGAMSDKDIAFLKSIATNLDRSQSEASFKKELGRIEDVLVRADKQLRAKFGAPAAGTPKPAGAPAAAPAATPGAPGGTPKNIVVDW